MSAKSRRWLLFINRRLVEPRTTNRMFIQQSTIGTQIWIISSVGSDKHPYVCFLCSISSAGKTTKTSSHQAHDVFLPSFSFLVLEEKEFWSSGEFFASLSLLLQYSTFMLTKAARLTNAKISLDINALKERERERKETQDVYRKRHIAEEGKERHRVVKKGDKYVRGKRKRRLYRNHLVGRLVLPWRNDAQRRKANIARESIASRRVFSLPVISNVLWETSENNNDLAERKTRKYRRYAELKCTRIDRIWLFVIVPKSDAETVAQKAS